MADDHEKTDRNVLAMLNGLMALAPTSPRHGALGSLAILALLRLRPANPYLWAAYAAQVIHERTHR